MLLSLENMFWKRTFPWYVQIYTDVHMWNSLPKYNIWTWHWDCKLSAFWKRALHMYIQWNLSKSTFHENHVYGGGRFRELEDLYEHSFGTKIKPMIVFLNSSEHIILSGPKHWSASHWDDHILICAWWCWSGVCCNVGSTTHSKTMQVESSPCTVRVQHWYSIQNMRKQIKI